jgi:hypothetical protein
MSCSNMLVDVIQQWLLLNFPMIHPLCPLDSSRCFLYIQHITTSSLCSRIFIYSLQTHPMYSTVYHSQAFMPTAIITGKHHSKPSLESSYSTSSSFTNSGFKAFDVEVELARALVTANPNSRPRHFGNVFEEFIFVFTVMMATASTVKLCTPALYNLLIPRC